MAKKSTSNSTVKKSKRERLVRPYPQVPLERAIRVPTAIKEANGGNPFEPASVAEYCEVGPKTNDFVYLLSASARFGLTSGTIRSEKISLTDFGRELVYADTPEQELTLKKQAFLQVEIFKRVLDHYRGSQLPEMKYLGNTLQKTFGLPTDLHEEFSSLFRQNCAYLGLDTASEELPAEGSDQQSAHSIILGEPKDKKGGVCFVIMPFTERSGRFNKGFFSEVLNSLIIPAATEAGFEVRTANRQGTDIIHSTIINEVINADLAICDLTEHNPNVLFELGIRLSNEKPVALIHAEGTERIFDVDNVLRVFPYSPNLWRTTLDKDVPGLRAHVAATRDGVGKNETYMSVLRKLREQK